MSNYNIEELNEKQTDKYIKEKMKQATDNEYLEEKEKRSKKRYLEMEKRKKRNKLIALTVAGSLALGAGTYLLKDKINSDKYNSSNDKNLTNYEKYVNYVKEQNNQGIKLSISEEGYKAFYNEHLKDENSKGSR